MTNTTRTANVSDYSSTDLVIWNPRFPYYNDSAPISGSYPMDCFEPAGNDAEQANEDGSLYLQPPCCSGGDYYGTSVERANHRAFMSEYGHIPGVVGTTSYPGGFGVVIKLSTVENNDDMAETINALYEYPVIDDEMLSEVEREIIEESESDFHDDARKYLIARYDDNTTVADKVEDAIDAMDSDVFMRELTIVGIEMGEEWVCESPISAYFNVEKVIDSMSDADVAALLNITADDLIAKPNLPPTDDLARLVRAVIAHNMVEFELAKKWHAEHENDDDYCEDDEQGEGYAYIDLTFGIDTGNDDENVWGFQTGDNSYTGGAYGYPDWAVVSLSKDSDPAEVVADIHSQLSELFYQR